MQRVRLANYGLVVAVNVVVATYVSFGITGFGFAPIPTLKNKVVVAPFGAVGKERLMIVYAEVEALSQHLSAVLEFTTELHAFDPLSRNACTISDVVEASTLYPKRATFVGTV